MLSSYERNATSGRSTDDALIVGDGLAGLALAEYLARQGREPTIVEQADEWRASGYGIGLWEDGLAALDEKDSRIEELETENEQKDARIDDLEEENDHLRDRLAAVEDRLGLDGAADSAPADD